MDHPLLDPSRLAMLRVLGLPVAYVRRSLLSPQTLAGLLPGLPGLAVKADAQTVRQPVPTPPQAGGQAPRPAPDARPPKAIATTPIAPEPRVARPPLTGPRADQIAALDMDGLRAFTLDCRACKLGGLRHQAVFGVGHPQAQVMVVGEAPGAEEDRQGEPFVGAAGKLLDNMLRSVGLARCGDDPARTVFIANVIKCRPPGNRNPEVDEIAQCEPILKRQIELVRPRLLLALGRFAAQTITGSQEPIGRLRQRVFDYQGIPVVVSYHPAYLLRSPLEKSKAWADLCFAQDTLASHSHAPVTAAS